MPHLRLSLMVLVPCLLIVIMWLRVEAIQQRVADLEEQQQPWEQEAGQRGSDPLGEAGPLLRGSGEHMETVDQQERVEQLSRRLDKLESMVRAGPGRQVMEDLVAGLEERLRAALDSKLRGNPGGDAGEPRQPRRAFSGLGPVGFAEFAACFELTEAQQSAVAAVVAETERALRDLHSTEDGSGRTWFSMDDADPLSGSPSDVIARFHESSNRRRAFGRQVIPGHTVTFSHQEEVIRARGAARIYQELTEAQRALWKNSRSPSRSLFVARQ